MTSIPPPRSLRDVKDVPFVELFNNRLQGVVSSGSDIERVYVSFFEAGTLNYSCSTNNNRPCGGLRGSPCKHLLAMLDQAIVQYGAPAVVRFLRVPAPDPSAVTTAREIAHYKGRQVSAESSLIFSRFLADLQILEAPQSNMPLHTMAWFPPR